MCGAVCAGREGRTGGRVDGCVLNLPNVTGAGAGVNSVWEQKKLEARKMLVNRAESPASSTRFVSPLLICKTHL